MSEKTVATVVAELLGVEISEEQALSLDAGLKIKSVPRAKMNYVKGEADASEIKLAPQAKILIGALNETPVSLEAWGDAAAKAGMKTTQDPARIAAYYRKDLVEKDLVSEVPAE